VSANPVVLFNIIVQQSLPYRIIFDGEKVKYLSKVLCVCVCVCVCVPLRPLITSGVIWCDIELL